MRLLVSALLLSSPGFAAVDIGVAAAVRGKVSATAPGGPAGRVVETGRPVYQNDKVTTGPGAKLQVLLADETSFTMGADSEMVLDEFVYDPAKGSGKVSARVTKGAFRFVTGKIARRDPADMKVQTPVATIGIRGTMVAGSVGTEETTVVLLGPGLENNADLAGGAITVGNERGSVEIDQDGWGVTIRNGEAPGRPFELPAGLLEGILSAVASAPQGNGDAGPGGSAGDNSGQFTAEGRENLRDAFAAIDSAQSEDNRFASQQFGAPHATTWEDVRGISTGSGRYEGSASYYDCTSGVCAASPTGTMTLGLNIDFGARTVGGSGSTLSFSGGQGPGTGSIPVTSYSALSGAAVTTLSSFNIGGATVHPSTLQLTDAGGVTAGAATMSVRYTNASPAWEYRGDVTGIR